MAVNDLMNLLNQIMLISNLVVTPIAGSSLVLTLVQYRCSLQQWRLYLILVIMLWYNISQVTYRILFIR